MKCIIAQPTVVGIERRGILWALTFTVDGRNSFVSQFQFKPDLKHGDRVELWMEVGVERANQS